MGGVNSLLSLGRGALNAHQQRMALVQHNLANATTPGYRRQRADLVTLGGALRNTELLGVSYGGRQSVDAPLVGRRLTFERAVFGHHAERAQIGTMAETSMNALGELDLSARLSEFFDGVRSLATDPGNGVERRELLARADAIGSEMARASSALVLTRVEVQRRTEELSQELNSKLAQISELDSRIRATFEPSYAADLIDRRDLLVAELSEQIGLRAVRSGGNGIYLPAVDGTTLLEDGKPRELSVKLAGDDLEVSVAGGATGSHTLRNPLGRLGGLISSHNDLLGDQLESLDQLAFDFGSRVNEVHRGGYALDGTSGHDFFVNLDGPHGAAGSLAVRAEVRENPELIAASSTPDGVPGDSSNLQALLDIEVSALGSGLSPAETYNDLTTRLGRMVSTAVSDSEMASAGIAQLESIQSSISGVSIEEEMINLTEAQRTFEAAAKVIQVADELLQTVLSLRP